MNRATISCHFGRAIAISNEMHLDRMLSMVALVKLVRFIGDLQNPQGSEEFEALVYLFWPSCQCCWSMTNCV